MMSPTGSCVKAKLSTGAELTIVAESKASAGGSRVYVGHCAATAGGVTANPDKYVQIHPLVPIGMNEATAAVR